MAAGSEPPRISFSQRFWALWAKIWWLVGLLLAVGVIALANINKLLLGKRPLKPLRDLLGGRVEKLRSAEIRTY